ncbi:hypothetical protein GWI33_013478 [Rhynchophorus ferrugineus]|uniref:Uncharacterized protein n=1 Tax=Rhynchophorus ferrugineus TaxID=354439 RepID=A0A834I6Z1_RHYFE|nr:hypothetical protein GWI33_013478 [Rhynchophorus ferrugineus]
MFKAIYTEYTVSFQIINLLHGHIPRERVQLKRNLSKKVNVSCNRPPPPLRLPHPAGSQPLPIPHLYLARARCLILCSRLLTPEGALFDINFLCGFGTPSLYRLIYSCPMRVTSSGHVPYFCHLLGPRCRRVRPRGEVRSGHLIRLQGDSTATVLLPLNFKDVDRQTYLAVNMTLINSLLSHASVPVEKTAEQNFVPPPAPAVFD